MTDLPPAMASLLDTIAQELSQRTEPATVGMIADVYTTLIHLQVALIAQARVSISGSEGSVDVKEVERMIDATTRALESLGTGLKNVARKVGAHGE